MSSMQQGTWQQGREEAGEGRGGEGGSEVIGPCFVVWMRCGLFGSAAAGLPPVDSGGAAGCCAVVGLRGRWGGWASWARSSMDGGADRMAAGSVVVLD